MSVKVWFAGINPLAKLAALLPVTAVVVCSLDLVSAGVSLGLSVLALCAAGLAAQFVRPLTLAVWIGAPLAALTIALYGRTGGDVLFAWGPIVVSDGSLELAAATFLRVLALALPSVVVFSSIDPSRLADALGQNLKFSARFVLGALAALRQVELIREDWRLVGFARRARGLGEANSLRGWPAASFGLFALSLRRGADIAVAMQARGLARSATRTWLRRAHWGSSENLVVLVGLLIAAASLAAALATGSWNFVWA